MRRVLLTVAVLAATAYPLMNAYNVEPVRAQWSGKARPDLGVSQTVTCCWDELDSSVGGYVELFVGENGGEGTYDLEIKLGDQVVAYQYDKPRGRNCDWLPFDSITMSPGRSFTKGKTYEFKFTRSGSDSIHFYCNTQDPYKYGDIILPSGGGFQPEPTTTDLCMRVYGVMDPVDSTFWGIDIPSVC